MPKTLDGFFKVCFILNHIEKTPVNAGVWLVYLLSFVEQRLCSYEWFQLIYSLDFLYANIELKENELVRLVDGLKRAYDKALSFAKSDGSFQSDKTLSPLEDTRYSLFVINVVEDLIQDVLFYYGNALDLKPVTRIYQGIPQIDKTYAFITK